MKHLQCAKNNYSDQLIFPTEMSLNEESDPESHRMYVYESRTSNGSSNGLHSQYLYALVIHHYNPRRDDELELDRGDYIQVLSTNPNKSKSEGWYLGRNKYMHIGVFPANYVSLQLFTSQELFPMFDKAALPLPSASMDTETHNEINVSSRRRPSFLTTRTSNYHRRNLSEPTLNSLRNVQIIDHDLSKNRNFTVSGNGDHRCYGTYSFPQYWSYSEPELDAPVDEREEENFGSISSIRPESLRFSDVRLRAKPSQNPNFNPIINTDIIRAESIGSGAFGTVYHGLWNNQDVALKVYRVRTDQIEKEALALSMLRHENIVKFYGVSEGLCGDPHAHVLVIEYAFGGSLKKVLTSRPTLSPLTLLGWLKQIASGMRYLHEDAKLFHRDLKPSNILLREKLQFPLNEEDLRQKTLIITDFGTSCSAHTDSLRRSEFGTIVYAAPEVLCRTGFSSSSDVWSYGILFWEIFTMMEPARHADAIHHLIEIANEKRKPFIPSDSKLFPLIIRQFLLDCWSDDPKDRPSFSVILERLNEAHTDAFFLIEANDFMRIQDLWREEIETQRLFSETMNPSKHSECSSTNTDNFSQTHMGWMLRKSEEERLRLLEILARTQNQLYKVGVAYANHLHAPSGNVALASTRRYRFPFHRDHTRRNQQRQTQQVSPRLSNDAVSASVLSSGGAGFVDGDGGQSTVSRKERSFAAVKIASASHHFRGRNGLNTLLTTNGGVPYISSPTNLKHRVHVPNEGCLVSRLSLANALNPSSPDMNSLPPASSPKSRSRTTSDATSSVFAQNAPVEQGFDIADAETGRYIACHFAFLENFSTAIDVDLQQLVVPDSDILPSCKSVPDLSKKSCVEPLAKSGRHTVSRGSALEAPSEQKSKPRRKGLGNLFHTSKKDSWKRRTSKSSNGGTPSNTAVTSPVPVLGCTSPSVGQSNSCSNLVSVVSTQCTLLQSGLQDASDVSYTNSHSRWSAKYFTKYLGQRKPPATACDTESPDLASALPLTPQQQHTAASLSRRKKKSSIVTAASVMKQKGSSSSGSSSFKIKRRKDRTSINLKGSGANVIEELDEDSNRCIIPAADVFDVTRENQQSRNGFCSSPGVSFNGCESRSVGIESPYQQGFSDSFNASSTRSGFPSGSFGLKLLLSMSPMHPSVAGSGRCHGESPRVPHRRLCDIAAGIRNGVVLSPPLASSVDGSMSRSMDLLCHLPTSSTTEPGSSSVRSNTLPSRIEHPVNPILPTLQCSPVESALWSAFRICSAIPLLVGATADPLENVQSSPKVESKLPLNENYSQERVLSCSRGSLDGSAECNELPTGNLGSSGTLLSRMKLALTQTPICDTETPPMRPRGRPLRKYWMPQRELSAPVDRNGTSRRKLSYPTEVFTARSTVHPYNFVSVCNQIRSPSSSGFCQCCHHPTEQHLFVAPTNASVIAPSSRLSDTMFTYSHLSYQALSQNPSVMRQELQQWARSSRVGDPVDGSSTNPNWQQNSEVHMNIQPWHTSTSTPPSEYDEASRLNGCSSVASQQQVFFGESSNDSILDSSDGRCSAYQRPGGLIAYVGCSSAASVGLGSSRHSSSTRSSISRLSTENPVGASRDAYLKVTQDGYLNRLNDGCEFQSPILHQSSTVFAPVYRGDDRQRLISLPITPDSHGSPMEPAFVVRYPMRGAVSDIVHDENCFVDPLEASFGAGEAAEDTATLYAEFQPPAASGSAGLRNSQATSPDYECSGITSKQIYAPVFAHNPFNYHSLRVATSQNEQNTTDKVETITDACFDPSGCNTCLKDRSADPSTPVASCQNILAFRSAEERAPIVLTQSTPESELRESKISVQSIGIPVIEDSPASLVTSRTEF